MRYITHWINSNADKWKSFHFLSKKIVQTRKGYDHWPWYISTPSRHEFSHFFPTHTRPHARTYVSSDIRTNCPSYVHVFRANGASRRINNFPRPFRPYGLGFYTKSWGFTPPGPAVDVLHNSPLLAYNMYARVTDIICHTALLDPFFPPYPELILNIFRRARHSRFTVFNRRFDTSTHLSKRIRIMTRLVELSLICHAQVTLLCWLPVPAQFLSFDKNLN